RTMKSDFSSDEIRAQVHRFWNAVSNKRASVEDLYFPSTTVFELEARRSETARLLLARKLRDFAATETSFQGTPGAIEVQMAGGFAIASYPCQYRSSTLDSDGSRVDYHSQYCRMTQIFQKDDRNQLRIIHEHFSQSEPGKRTKIEAAAARTASFTSTQLISAMVDRSSVSLAALAPVDSAFAEQIRAEVARFWRFYTGKSKDDMQSIYFPDAVVFPADGRRSEPARLCIARRTREFFGPMSSVSAKPSTIDVQGNPEDAGIASYCFHFKMVRMYANGKRFAIDIPFTRLTQVFRKNESGAFNILHEHMSAAVLPTFTELPVSQPAMAAT
ncbi:MAG TPA: hypothetical protein VI685_05005, partial [Candidatus Angelobacter sp.]